jgi:4-amino-4-deoxy-L-arabinose transferase-like glycosyltransferase
MINKSANTKWKHDLTLLLLLLIVVFITLLGHRQLTVPDEARYAEIPREMVVNNDYITPTLNYLKYFQKPPLFYWLQAGAIHAFGLSEWTVRLPNALLATLGCLLTYITARQYYGRRCGWLASIILATSALYFIMGHYITLDMTLTVMLSGSLFSFMLGIREPPGWCRTGYFWSMFLFAALAVLTKGLVGIIFPGMIIFVWLCLTNRWRELKTYHLLSGSLLFLLLVLPWHILVQHRNPEFFNYYFLDQQFLRYFTSYAGRQQPIWYLPLFLVGGFLPWIGFLPQAIHYHWGEGWQKLRQQGDILFLLVWAALIYLFFQVSHSQLPPYIVPIFPPLAILLARYFDAAWQTPFQYGIRWGFICALLFSLVVAIGAFLLPLFSAMPLPHLLWVTLIVTSIFLVLATLLALRIYRQRGLPGAFILLAVATSIFFIIIFNLVYPPLDPKTIKPLALQIDNLYRPGDKIVAYHTYYQDLPYYTRQRITLVNWQGEELAFGMQHQPTKDWVLEDAAFWQLWHSSQRVFLILSLSNFKNLQHTLLPPFKHLGETSRNVLLTNHPIKEPLKLVTNHPSKEQLKP